MVCYWEKVSPCLMERVQFHQLNVKWKLRKIKFFYKSRHFLQFSVRNIFSEIEFRSIPEFLSVFGLVRYGRGDNFIQLSHFRNSTKTGKSPFLQVNLSFLQENVRKNDRLNSHTFFRKFVFIFFINFFSISVKFSVIRKYKVLYVKLKPSTDEEKLIVEKGSRVELIK